MSRLAKGHIGRRAGAWAAAGLLGLLLPLAAAANPPGYYGYGKPATQEQIAGWNIDVRPDGKGLPPGSGSVQEGATVYQAQCASCHGTFGEGMGRFPVLAGGMESLTDDRPEKTVGSYWPYASTLWDYIHRAMPFYAPQSLTDDQVYAIVAYILNLNNIVGADFVASQDNLASIEMPNADGFIRPDPRPDTQSEACMESCKDPAEIEIVSTAEGKKLTPSTTGPLDDGLAKK